MSGQDLRRAQCFGKFHLRGLGLRIEKIGADGVVEKVGVLHNGADALMQRIELRLANVDPVDRDRAILHVIEPGDQVSDGGLTPAGRADERDELARFGDKGDVVQHRFLRRLIGHGNRFQRRQRDFRRCRVAERDPIERNLCRTAGNGDGLRIILNHRRQVEHFEDAFEGDERGHHG